MNKLCVPRGTIGVFGFGKYGAAARIAEKLSIQEKSRRPWKLEITESLRKGRKVQDRVRL